MKKETLVIKKFISLKSKKARFDLIRGKPTKGAHKKGVIELIHGDIWSVPLPAIICRYLLSDMPSLGLKSTHECVLRAIIGNTWNFKKAGEFITWNHLLNGKHDIDTGEPIVGGANISRGSLKSAIDTLIRKGIVQRITIEDNTGSNLFYAPSTWANGHFIMQPNFGEDYWSGNNADQQFLIIINELFTPILPVYYSQTYRYTDDDRFELCSILISRLKHPSLLKIFLSEWPYHLHSRALQNNKIRDGVIKELEYKDTLPLNKKSYEYYKNKMKENMDEIDNEWLSQPSIQEFILQLVSAKENLDSGILLNDKAGRILQAKILLAMWGKDLITLSSDVWEIWTALVECQKNLCLTTIHKEILQNRQTIPWFK